jgi:Xaa-Pro aminopeptidase
MDRRQFLGAGVATLGAAAGAQAAAPGKTASIAIDETAIKAGLGKAIPVNRARAVAVLDELKLDGVIALRPHNVYYLTNTIPTLTLFGDEFPAFATFAKDQSQPSFLISSNGNTWETSNGDRDVPPVITYSGPRNWQEYVNATPEKMRVEPEAFRSAGFAVREGAALTPREAAWKKAQETYNPNAAATPAWALVRALKQSGLAKGRIAVDDMRVAYLLSGIGFDSVTLIPGDNVFRRIRHIKTENEIALMRVAQRITQQSAMAALRALEPGMTYDQFRQRFFAETTARGGEPGFVLFGVTQGLLPDGVVKKGRSYLLDCSMRFKSYQGDFARTVSIGEPSAESLRRFKAQQAGREAAFAIIKPGVPFRKVVETARDAMIKAGMPKELPTIVLHSVGLQHGDDPTRLDVSFAVGDDHVLAENMTVTLDLPYVEVGWGAGHNEDLLRITKTGYEILNDPAEPMVIV